MIRRFLLLLSCLALITGCQNLPLVSNKALVQTPARQTIIFTHDDLQQHCMITQSLFDGSYIATGTVNSIHYSLLALATNTPDLWDVLAKQLEFDVPNNQRTNYYRRWFINNPYHIKTVTTRAEPFLYYLYQQVKKRDLPIELVLLPFIESSFDPYAHSHKGASGLWQITAATGRTFGLKITRGYDGRRDVIASTQAALDLLEYLYDKFDQNWLHAIAAYNTGEGRVRNAIKHNRTIGRSTDFWSLKLPKETRQYVPKLLAMADLVKNRHQYDLSFIPIKAKPVVDEVIIRNRVKLKTIAELADISSKQLYQLNPGYKDGYTFNQRDNKVLMPIHSRTQFYESKHSKSYAKPTFDVYHIQAGDSLNEVAQLNNTSVALIKQINNLTDSLIIAGQKILIPTN
ncbi:transglycosylase SLT domain-containing protein [Photobacterium nomapromontoriensis]|uniref:transglycosylase SLT domain-containing protein n=1 Tax=Photobacterium nomapromontoriensis TaxID=2910237 RepID=UPI003D113DBD